MTARRRLFRLPWRSAQRIRADVDDELRFHLDMRIAVLTAAGQTRDAAREQALREFGDLDDARRYLGAVDRDIEAAQRRSDRMSDLWQDLGYAVRQLASSRAFTFTAVMTLALGIGANTALFSVVNSVLLEPLPFPKADHLVRVVHVQQGELDAGAPADLADNRARATTFAGFSTMDPATANLSFDHADAERVPAVRVSANFFDVLRVRPLVGRFFLDGEDQPGAPNVVVLSEQLWRRSYGGDSSLIGKSIRINAAPFTVVGVLTAGQRYPFNVELWMPKIFDSIERGEHARDARWLGLVARVRDEVSVADASAEVTHISEALETEYPVVFRQRRAHLTTIQEYHTGSVRRPLFLMFGAAAFVLLIACANVANLMLVRASARKSEMAIRTALGAGRGRLARQLVTESMVLSLCGGVAGIGAAELAMHAMLSHAPASLMVVATASIDGRALGVTALGTVLTGLLFGILPIAQAHGYDLATALRAGGRGSRSNVSATRAKRVIVVAEVALAVTLLTGAGLLLHSFANLLAVDPGFHPQGVLSMKVALPQRTYDSTAQRNFLRAVEQRLRGVPGVSNVGISNFIPLDGTSYAFGVTIRGQAPPRPGEQPTAEVRMVSPGFFATMGMPLVGGRGIAVTDQPGSSRVLVVNEAFAARLIPGGDAVGHIVSVGWGPEGADRTIVGVVGDVHGAALADAPDPTVYAPIAQVPFPFLTIVARTRLSPASLTLPVRTVVHDLDRDVPIYSVHTLGDLVASSVDSQHFTALLIAMLAAVAVLLSAVGLYGVIAYAVSQQSHEFGIRIALGATSGRLSRMVIGEGMALTAAGLVLGIIGSLFAERLVTSLLFGIAGFDLWTFAGVILILSGIAGLASWLPARRAARADPLVALRAD